MSNNKTETNMARSHGFLRSSGPLALSLMLFALPGHAQSPEAAKAKSSFNDPRSSKIKTGPEDKSIRPFRIAIPQKDLSDLRRRIAATRWPDHETVDDQSQGVQLAKLQALVS